MTTRPREPDINLTLSIDQMNQVLMYLGKQPFEQVADLVMNIRTQAQQQIQQFQQGQPGFQMGAGNGEDRPAP